MDLKKSGRNTGKRTTGSMITKRKNELCVQHVQGEREQGERRKKNSGMVGGLSTEQRKAKSKTIPLQLGVSGAERNEIYGKKTTA